MVARLAKALNCHGQGDGPVITALNSMQALVVVHLKLETRIVLYKYAITVRGGLILLVDVDELGL